jgi:hypothetical protein
MNALDTAAWVDIVWKLGTPIGFAAMFFFKTQFVSKLKYYEDRKSDSLQLNGMDRKLDLLGNNLVQIADHEARLRAIEKDRGHWQSGAQ